MWSRISQLVRSRAFLSTALVVVLLSIGAAILMLSNTPGPVPETTTTTSATTTTSFATTTTQANTTATPHITSQINGLPVDDSALLSRRVLAVKIDNHPIAQPQSGIDRADMVIELMVEGITRFMTVWQQSDSEYLGPMRSGRPTDPTLLQAFNEPTFVISGAQSWVQNLIRSKGIQLIGEVRPETFRISGRFAPHNLYVDTTLLREYADSRGYPDQSPDGPLWAFGPMPAGAPAASSVRLNFSGNIVNWVWDETTGTWLREVDRRPSNWRNQDDEEGQIGFPVLVALYVEQYSAFPPNGVSGTALPSSRTTGSGTAFVFAEGKVLEGTWEREAETDWFTLIDADDQVIMVPPGQVWVSLVPTTSGLTWE
jgi:hypothetical protein